MTSSSRAKFLSAAGTARRATLLNQRFVDAQLIEQGAAAAEASLRAQERAGDITAQELEASLIVNQRIQGLQQRRLEAVGEERDAIVAILNDLQTRYPEIVARIAENLQTTTDQLSLQAQALQTVAESFGRGLERGIVRAVREGGKLRDIFAQIGREITGTILGALTRLGVNALFSAIGLPGFGGGRQFGGLALPGRVYQVHRDELIVPANPARVIPAGAGGGNNVVINLDARGSDEASFQASLQRALPQLAEIFRADAVESVRFGINNPSPLYQGG